MAWLREIRVTMLYFSPVEIGVSMCTFHAGACLVQQEERERGSVCDDCSHAFGQEES